MQAADSKDPSRCASQKALATAPGTIRGFPLFTATRRPTAAGAEESWSCIGGNAQHRAVRLDFKQRLSIAFSKRT